MAWAQSTRPAAPPGVDPATHARHVAQDPAAHAGDANTDLVNQIAALRAEVAKLQAALAQGHAPQPTAGMASAPGRAMPGMAGGGMMQKRMGVGQMSQMQSPQTGGGMSGMGAGGAGGGMGMMDMDNMMGGGGGMSGGGGMGGMMSMMDNMMSMGMSRMGGGMGGGSMGSVLPGFPGASHIYHVGATGFFLDHATHITLTVDQQKQLGEIKEQALLDQASLERKIEQAEQELWNLTGSDQPDAAKVETKAREIEKLRVDQRIDFIRAVGKAAGVLTDEQRKQLTGMLPANPAPSNQPMTPSGGMGGMPDM
ncbi:MAG: periplasmic heavy metal sensor [Phycisphaerales bacterium]|nr:periplasmic heavy metal sensor [Phycisphaerales bacterium]